MVMGILRIWDLLSISLLLVKSSGMGRNASKVCGGWAGWQGEVAGAE